ncbi:hypothetical protein DMH27_01455 [Raoultella planticola]|nr:hypothetical protein [Raoultella planticola]
MGWTHHDKPWLPGDNVPKHIPLTRPYAVTLELIKPGTATQNVTPEEHRLTTGKAQLSKGHEAKTGVVAIPAQVFAIIPMDT